MLSQEELLVALSRGRGRANRERIPVSITARGLSRQEMDVAQAVFEGVHTRYAPLLEQAVSDLCTQISPEATDAMTHLMHMFREFSRATGIEGFRQGISRAALAAGDIVDKDRSEDLPTEDELSEAIVAMRINGQMVPDEGHFGLTREQRECAQAVSQVIEKRYAAVEMALIHRIVNRSEAAREGSGSEADLERAMEEAMNVSKLKMGEMLAASYGLGLSEGQKLAVDRFTWRLRTLVE